MHLFLYVSLFVWVLLGIAAWGYYHGSHKNAMYCMFRPNNWSTFFTCLCGPPAFIAVWTVHGLKHFSLIPITDRERWVKFQERFPKRGDKDKITFEQFLELI